MVSPDLQSSAATTSPRSPPPPWERRSVCCSTVRSGLSARRSGLRSISIEPHATVRSHLRQRVVERSRTHSPTHDRTATFSVLTSTDFQLFHFELPVLFGDDRLSAGGANDQFAGDCWRR